jgi:voltage-gated potassium channel
VGRTFREASEWYLTEKSAVLVGVLSKGRGMALEDLLSDDSSAIDAFIKRKFQEAEMDLSRETGSGDEIRLAPGPDYLIRDSDWAFTVGSGVR